MQDEDKIQLHANYGTRGPRISVVSQYYRESNGSEEQGNSQLLLPPAPPYYPFPRRKSILGVTYGVLLWADMNTATPLGA